MIVATAIEVERHLDAGVARQELEAGRDARLHHVLRGVLHEEPDDGDHRCGRRHLPEDIANLAVAEKAQQRRLTGREA
jgi:hypothetical protein